MQQAPYSNAPDLSHKEERQAALRRYHILDTAPEKNFDRITSLVADLCDVSSALISLIDSERQWFKSCFNFNARETDVGVSFCVHAVHQGELLIVEDATQHPDFKDNPLVTGPPHIRFYAGAPLTTPDGVHIGSLCIIDYEPRAFDAAQREILERLADLVVSEFELRSAEAQFRQLYDENPQPMYVHDADTGALLAVNQSALQQYGYDRSDFVGRSVDALRAPDEAQPPAGGVVMHVRQDGSYLPVQVRQSKILYDGKTAYLAVPRHVSDRRGSEQTLFFQTDMEGTTRSLSPSWTDVTGFSVAETVGESLLDFLHPLDRRSTREAFEALLDGQTDTCVHEARFTTETGSQTFEMYARLLTDNDDAPTGVAGSLTPVIDVEGAGRAALNEPTAEAPSDPPDDVRSEAPRDVPSEVGDAASAADADPVADEPPTEPMEPTPEPLVATESEATESEASDSTSDDAEPSPAAAEATPDASGETALETGVETGTETGTETEASDESASSGDGTTDPFASGSPLDDATTDDPAASTDPAGAAQEDGGSFLRDLGIDEDAAPGTLTPGDGPAPQADAPPQADATPQDDVPQADAASEGDAGTTDSRSQFEREETGDGSIFGAPSDPEVAVDPKLDAIRASDLDPSTFDLVAQIRDAIARQERHHNGAVDVHTDLPDAPVEVSLDPRFVDAVVTVLLSNAIQYSGGDGVAVRCLARDEDVVIEVQDAGSSIEERFLDDYVNAGDEADASEDVQAVHDLVHRMEGRVNMESSLESGTVFTIALPRTLVDDSTSDAADDLFPLA